MRALLAVFLCTSLIFVSSSAQAAGRRRAARPSKQVQAAAIGQSMYPKYYGGMHERQFQNIGVPTGDIGLRGNGITWTPW